MIDTRTATQKVDDWLALLRMQLRFREVPPGSNAGVPVEAYLRHVGLLKGNPWCGAGMSWAGYFSGNGDDWPLLRSGRVQLIYEDAKRKGLLVELPRRGDLFVRWYPSLKRFGHIGALQLDPYPDSSWRTIEGNTLPDHVGDMTPAELAAFTEREGYGWFEKTRGHYADTSRYEFIRPWLH